MVLFQNLHLYDSSIPTMHNSVVQFIHSYTCTADIGQRASNDMPPPSGDDGQEISICNCWVTQSDTIWKLNTQSVNNDKQVLWRSNLLPFHSSLIHLYCIYWPTWVSQSVWTSAHVFNWCCTSATTFIPTVDLNTILTYNIYIFNYREDFSNNFRSRNVFIMYVTCHINTWLQLKIK